MFYTVIKAIANPIIHLLFNLKFEGRENIPEDGALVVCSNHRSFIDPAFIALGFKKRQFCFMAKKEIFSFKPLGFIFKRLGAFPVDRGAGDVVAIKTAEEYLKNGRPLMIFPEGTRSKDGNPLRPKSGAVYIASDTGADILPVAICFEGKKLFLFKKVTVCFGKPIPHREIKMPEDNKIKESRKVSALVMDRIIKMLNSHLKNPVKRPFMPASTASKGEKNEK